LPTARPLSLRPKPNLKQAWRESLAEPPALAGLYFFSPAVASSASRTRRHVCQSSCATYPGGWHGLRLRSSGLCIVQYSSERPSAYISSRSSSRSRWLGRWCSNLANSATASAVKCGNRDGRAIGLLRVPGIYQPSFGGRPGDRIGSMLRPKRSSDRQMNARSCSSSRKAGWARGPVFVWTVSPS
jgi:hypothetical protein